MSKPSNVRLVLADDVEVPVELEGPTVEGDIEIWDIVLPEGAELWNIRGINADVVPAKTGLRVDLSPRPPSGLTR